jgi:methylthioribose-1-phosphate isomerase
VKLNFRTVAYNKRNNEIVILDQISLPTEKRYLRLRSVNDVYKAIKNMNLRGAPLIGVAAAYGVVLAAARSGRRKEIIRAADYIKSARPTAVNLSWAIERMKDKISAASNLSAELLKEARSIEEEDKAACERIGEWGARLIPNKARIMVHCNAGALATSGIGTALGIIYTAKAKRKKITVYASETRPLLQGARLTSWELTANGIKTYTLCDNMAANYMPEMDLVLVGADRIAVNGDTANKIGTRGLAIIARHYRIPFYVAAPLSTFDPRIKSGADIPIEIRSDDEVRRFNKKEIAAPRAKICNPAFDVTPASLITGIITEKGIIKSPRGSKIRQVLKKIG